MFSQIKHLNEVISTLKDIRLGIILRDPLDKTFLEVVEEDIAFFSFVRKKILFTGIATLQFLASTVTIVANIFISSHVIELVSMGLIITGCMTIIPQVEAIAPKLLYVFTLAAAMTVFLASFL